MHPYPSPEQVSMRSMPRQYPFPSSTAKPTKPPKLSLRKSRGFYITRLLLRAIIVLLSLSIIGILSAALHSYHHTQHVQEPYAEGSGSYPVWSRDGVKMVGILWLLGTACVAAGLGIILLVASASEKVRHMTKTGNVTTVVVSIVGLVLWIAVTAYYASWDTRETGWDLMSWACTHSGPEYHYGGIDFGGICGQMVSPSSFLIKLCADSHTSVSPSTPPLL
jgi:hypothetical protein